MTDIPNRSEVARIWQKIREEDAASWRALYSMSVVARHAFINKRLTNTLNYVEQYEPVIGEDAVTAVVNEWQTHLVDSIRESERARA